jgi:hypothetical protein
MIGAHRGGVGNPAVATVKVTRFWVTLAGLVLVPPALIALDIYCAVAGTSAERTGAVVFTVAAVVASAIWRGDLRWHRRPRTGE